MKIFGKNDLSAITKYVGTKTRTRVGQRIIDIINEF